MIFFLPIHCHIPENTNFVSHFCSAERKLRHSAITCFAQVIPARPCQRLDENTGLWASAASPFTFEHGKRSPLHNLKADFSRNSRMFKTAGSSLSSHPAGVKFWITVKDGNYWDNNLHSGSSFHFLLSTSSAGYTPYTGEMLLKHTSHFSCSDILSDFLISWALECWCHLSWSVVALSPICYQNIRRHWSRRCKTLDCCNC